MISVWHNRDFLKHALDSSAPVKNILVSYVATVPTADPEIAYRLTNHIDTNWNENPDILVNKELTGKPIRSTSVGDILIHGDKCLIVESYGFRELSREEQSEITYHS
jgi:hypothetical protein